jgi:hypothetical protein
LQLTDAIADLGRPIDEASAALTELEKVIARAGDNGPKVVAIVVSVVNTGKVEATRASPSPPGSETPATTGATATGTTGVAATGTAAVSVGGVAGVSPAAPTDVSVEATLDPDLAREAEALGQRLRTALSALEATPDRVAALGAAVKDVVLQVPPLAVEATATAQIDIANPFASDEAKAQAQANLKRINAAVQNIQKAPGEIQAQVVSLPSKALAIVAKARTVLLGATLHPPAAEQTQVEFALSKPKSDPKPVTQSQQAQVEPKSFQWGWFLASSLAGGVTVTGAIVYASANSAVAACDDSAFGCRNRAELAGQGDWGLVLLSGGAAATVTLLTTGILLNSGGAETPQSARLKCGIGGLTVACGGQF